MHGPILLYSIIGGLLFVMIFGAVYLRRKFRIERESREKLRGEVAALQQEKKVIYDFLHDLGEAFTEEMDREHLLRIIVTCARKVTAAQGAAIYLWNPDRTKLMAAMVSGNFPPPLKVDNVVADQLAARTEDLESFLRLEPIPADSRAAIAVVARGGVPMHV